MIQILSVINYNKRIEICRKANVEYYDDLHIIASYNENQLPEQCAIFQYEKDIGKILWIDTDDNDPDLTIGLGKSVLSIMELRGVDIVYMDSTLEKLALVLGFKSNGHNFELNLKGYFSCNCKHK